MYWLHHVIFSLLSSPHLFSPLFSSQSYSKEKWGDWRPHLAVILSNETGDSALRCKSIVNLGDILGTKLLTLIQTSHLKVLFLIPDLL